MRQAPDVLVIVLDCVRDSDFQPSLRKGYLPFMEAAAPEFVRYDRALAPASWTVPSHASLFSGLYPWQHGITTFSGLTPKPGIRFVASHLRDHGYSTVSCSANFLIGTELGIVDDFDQAFWGGWWEPYLRYPIPHAPTIRMLKSVPFDSVVARSREWHLPTGIPGLLRKQSSLVLRHVFLLDLVNRYSRFLLGGSQLPRVSPWVEPTLENWLSHRPADRPTYAFVNLLDAHEPYFSVTMPYGLRQWMRYARLPQERWGWIDGATRVPPDQLVPLHDIYRSMISILDARIQRICEIYRKAGRWDNTLVVITSDHGQSFGDHGRLFHAQGVEEEIVHVPLWVRYPHAEGGGARIDRWASLIDLVPTIDEVAQIPNPLEGPGVSLRRLAEGPRSEPILTMSDGYGHRMVAEGSPKRKTSEAPVSVAACFGRWKVIVDDIQAVPRTRAFEVLSDPHETRDLWDPGVPEMARLESLARGAASGIMVGNRAPLKADVADRLASWGYA